MQRTCQMERMESTMYGHINFQSTVCVALVHRCILERPGQLKGLADLIAYIIATDIEYPSAN
jgi:hypothetical protein